MAPIAYVFTQTKDNKKEEIAKKIRGIHTEEIQVMESKPINGLYEIVEGGLRLQNASYTTAAKISISDDSRQLERLKKLLSKKGVTDPLILIQYETLIPTSSIGPGSNHKG